MHSHTPFSVACLCLALTACGGGGGGGAGSSGGGSISTPAPSVSLSSSVSSISAKEPFTLTWSSSNATSCSASGAWSGSKVTSGNEEITEQNAGNNTYTLSCSGSGGSGNSSVTIEITQAVIKIDTSDLSYRVPEGGDLTVYDYSVTAREYGSFGLIQEASDSGTFDLEYFTTSLPAFLADAWVEFEVRSEKQSFSGGELDSIETRNKAYSTRVLNVSNSEGFYVSYVDADAFYGSTFYPRLEANSSFSENWEFRYNDETQRRFGTSTFTVSGIEVLDTSIGPIEAFRISLEESTELRSRSFSGEYTIPEEVEEEELVAWIHPKIGLIKAEGTAKTDDTPYSEDSYIEGDVLFEIRSTNIVLPD